MKLKHFSTGLRVLTVLVSSCGVTEVGQHCSGNDMLPDGTKPWISVDLPSMKSSGLEPEDYFTQVHKLDSTWNDICMVKLSYISFCIYDCKHIEVLISIPVVNWQKCLWVSGGTYFHQQKVLPKFNQNTSVVEFLANLEGGRYWPITCNQNCL